jgi:hypothetical protein
MGIIIVQGHVRLQYQLIKLRIKIKIKKWEGAIPQVNLLILSLIWVSQLRKDRVIQIAALVELNLKIII